MSVNESINKMLELLHELLKCLQSEVKWVFAKGMNTASMDTIYFSSDDILALYDLVHLDMRQMVRSAASLNRSAKPPSALSRALRPKPTKPRFRRRWTPCRWEWRSLATQNVFVEMHSATEMEVVASFIKLSFASVHLVLAGVPVDQLLLSPFVITQQMLRASAPSARQPTLLSLHAQISRCCDGILRHLAQFEEVSTVSTSHADVVADRDEAPHRRALRGDPGRPSGGGGRLRSSALASARRRLHAQLRERAPHQRAPREVPFRPEDGAAERGVQALHRRHQAVHAELPPAQSRAPAARAARLLRSRLDRLSLAAAGRRGGPLGRRCESKWPTF